MTGPARGVDIEFEAGGIQQGAGAAASTAEAATPVLDRLRDLVITGAPFGQVTMAGPLASALDEARTGFRDLVLRVHEVHTDLARRAAAAADLGAELVTDTTDAASHGSALR